MKILYVGMKNEYGRPEAGLSFEHHNIYDSLVKMNNGENDVIYFAFDEVMRRDGRNKMNEKLLETVEKEKPDLCFFFLFTDEIKKKTIKEISDREDTVTFNWFTDDHWRFSIYSKYWAPLFSWVSTTDSKAVSKYKEMGYKNIIKTQWACNHFTHRKTGSGIKHDITFVGQSHGDRKRTIEAIKKEGLSVKCWGSGWPSGRIGQAEMIRLFSESKINLNLTESSNSFHLESIAKVFLIRRVNDLYYFLEPIGKVFLNRRADDTYQLRNPLLWPANIISLTRERREQIKGRTFEIPGSGGFLLTSDADNLTDYFEDGREIVIFKNTKDLIDKAKYYLVHEDKRSVIADAGYKRVLAEHTYERRFNDIFRAMNLVE